MKKSLSILIAILAISQLAYGQSDWKNHQSQFHKEAVENGTRTNDGIPGPNYWVNHTTYKLTAELNPAEKTLTGKGQIIFKNHSPDTLRYILIRCMQDIYKAASARDFDMPPSNVSEGIQIDHLLMNGKEPRIYPMQTNRALIPDRTEPILPGSEVNIEVSWTYQIPTKGFRNGALNDSIYFIGFWYPQVAVYDDLMGWDRDPHTGKTETYNDIADFSVSISAPKNYLVWATGKQLNEDQVYSKLLLSRINESRNHNTIQKIASSPDYPSGELFADTHHGVWEFRAKGVPDFAFAASSYAEWDAGMVYLDDNKNKSVWINAVYPAGASYFDEVAEYASKSISYFSNEFPAVDYPYFKHITVNALEGNAMEYPMMANNGALPQKDETVEVTAHEIGHTYFPFIVNVNEKAEAWIDEGITTLLGSNLAKLEGFPPHTRTVLNTLRYFNIYAPSVDNAPLGLNSYNVRSIAWFAHNYAKSSFAQEYLYQVLKELGAENPLKDFILTWKNKHPTGFDYLRFMETKAGEDLSWFINPWYYEMKAPDVAIGGVKTQNNNYLIKLLNKGGLPVPVRLIVTYENNQTETINKTALIWSDSDIAIIELTADQKVNSVEVDISTIPDVKPENNKFLNH